MGEHGHGRGTPPPPPDPHGADLLPVAREAAALARRIIADRAPRSVSAKGDRDMVTDVDLAVEEALRDFLGRETPGLGVLGEEGGRTGGGADAPYWVVDPVDGTANLARGIPLCGATVALVRGRTAVAAAIDFPFLGTAYAAAAGVGAYCGDERLHVSETADEAAALVSVGDFAVGPGAEAKNRVRLGLLERLGARVQRIRMLGTAAADLAWTAHGRLDAALILANRPWDTAAGVLLVREAGGAVLDRDGSEHTVDSEATIAVAPGVREALMAEVERAYGSL
ncbi:inositol monophosphatase [Nocardiopsis sp. RSe5-2]|uniref:inositol-phosphate phosphatase n=1 Tax=Nocardiopsis endophytica TaxID=3018445 RepID=A0ABT4TZN6_9ACTN|nr:inositol monophosphatase family protein [Nocardiopsis endophytica]MDA2810163.1 inositol monophosphatase [Nocardiopsis endophytica]